MPTIMISQLFAKTTFFVLVTSLTCCCVEFGYSKLCKSPIFIDKSKLLRIFFSSENRRNFITCPRRFGKTTNLQMIRAFAQIELDKSKKPVNWEESRNQKIFKNANISGYPRIVSRHMARYAVILVDLNSEHMIEPTSDDIFNHLNGKISYIYQQYRWIMNESYSVQSEDIAYMKKVLNRELNDDEKSQYFYRLAKIVFDALGGTKTIVLIDDYDSPLTKLPFDETLDTSRYYRVLNNMLSMAYTEGSPYIDYILITGTSSMTYYSSHSGQSINTSIIPHRPFLEDHPLVSFCGILEKELTSVLDRRDFSDKDRFQLKECYNGYSTRLKHRTIYNPYSVNQYLNKTDCNVTEYWKQRHQEQHVKFYPRPNETDVDRYWSIDLRDRVIFTFIYFAEFLNDISIPAHTDNRVQINSTFSKMYEQDSFQKFSQFLKFIYNFSPKDAPQIARDRQIYLPIFRTFAFEHGYFTHSLKEGFYGVPNCEVKMEIIDRIAKLSPPKSNEL